MALRLRLKKPRSNRFTNYQLDESVYNLNELQILINYGLEHKSGISVGIATPRKRFFKFKPHEFQTITVENV